MVACAIFSCVCKTQAQHFAIEFAKRKSAKKKILKHKLHFFCLQTKNFSVELISNEIKRFKDWMFKIFQAFIQRVYIYKYAIYFGQ